MMTFHDLLHDKPTGGRGHHCDWSPSLRAIRAVQVVMIIVAAVFIFLRAQTIERETAVEQRIEEVAETEADNSLLGEYSFTGIIGGREASMTLHFTGDRATGYYHCGDADAVALTGTYDSESKILALSLPGNNKTVLRARVGSDGVMRGDLTRPDNRVANVRLYIDNSSLQE